MADKVINVTVSSVNTKNVTVSSKQVANEISATADSSIYYSQLAKNWAIGEGLIQNEDYSSKTYAGVAQEAAENAQGSADTAQAFVNDFSGVVDNAITEIDGVKTEALTAVTSSKDLALSDISATQSSALTEIGDLKNSSLTEISTSSTTALGNINIVGQNYIDNINATGKGYDNLTHRQITNCLLEVPQRIKYELVDGVLTIKKGSQVIVPYGTTDENFTRVGSPTIVDGVASGFSKEQNYITIPFTYNNFTIKMPLLWNGTLPVSSDYYYRIENSTRTEQIVLYQASNGGIEILTIVNGTTFYDFGRMYILANTPAFVTIEKHTGKIYVKVEQENKITFEKTVTTNIPTFDNNSVCNIGKVWNTESFCSIDLKQFSITVDGKLVYRPEAVHENFTRVGSPTIVDGVASGFTGNDCLKFSLDQIDKPFRIITKFTTPATPPTDNKAIFSLTTGWSNTYIAQRDNYIKAFFYFTDKTSVSDKNYFAIQNNTTYYLALEFTGDRHNLYLSTDITTLFNEPQLVTEGNVPPIITQITIGNHAQGSYSFSGSIDLKQFSITVDDKVVYRPYIQKGDRFLNDNFKVADTQYEDGKFFVWAEVQNDTTRSISGNTSCFLQLGMNDGTFSWYTVASATSGGSTAPTGSSLWFDTTNNYAKGYNGGNFNQYTSLPTGIFTLTDGYITSFEPFNGMGYIGSTVWVDKGVKGLIPNGRNEDGTLKNIEFVTSKLDITEGNIFTGTNIRPVWLYSNGIISTGVVLYEQETPPTINSSGVERWFNTAENVWYYHASGETAWRSSNAGCVFGYVTSTGGVITNFQPKLSFHAPNIQDVVRKAGDTMSGALELYGTSSHLGLFGGAIYTHAMDMALDDKPSGDKFYAVVQHEDKNMVRKSRLESYWATDGSHGVLISEKKNASTNSYAKLLVGFDANGNAYTYAPHSSYTNSIVTQAGLSKATNGYMKFGNGLIIQWGVHSSGSGGNEYTITLPTAFSNTNYSVVGVSRGDKVSNSDYQVHLKITSKTQFKKTGQVATGLYWFAIGY